MATTTRKKSGNKGGSLPIGGGTGPAAEAIHKALADSVNVAAVQSSKDKATRKARGDVERAFAPLAGVMNLSFDPLHETLDTYRTPGKTFIHGMREGLFEAVTVTEQGIVLCSRRCSQ
jgi:hypothetical protein